MREVAAPTKRHVSDHKLLRSDFTSFVQKAFRTISPGDAYSANWHIEAMA
jgi:hypothetical protein